MVLSSKCGRLLLLRLAMGMIAAGALQGSTFMFTGLGTDIIGGDDTTPGVVVLSIPVVDTHKLFSTGNNVTVTLTGLEHPFAGDLVVTLSLVDNSNVTLASADLFNRIGKVSSDPDDFGYLTQFGDSISIDSGNYVFNSGFTGQAADLWAVASSLGSSDSIPSGNYWPSSSFSSAVDNLSSAFNGQSIGGTWQLTIRDYGPLTDNFVASLQSWTLQFEVADAQPVPEPGSAILVGVGLGILFGAAKKLQKRRQSN